MAYRYGTNQNSTEDTYARYGMDPTRYEDPEEHLAKKAMKEGVGGVMISAADRDLMNEAFARQDMATGAYFDALQRGDASVADAETSMRIGGDNYRMLAAGNNPLAARAAMMGHADAVSNAAYAGARQRAVEMARARAAMQDIYGRRMQAEMAMQGLDLDARKQWRNRVGIEQGAVDAKAMARENAKHAVEMAALGAFAQGTTGMATSAVGAHQQQQAQQQAQQNANAAPWGTGNPNAQGQWQTGQTANQSDWYSDERLKHRARSMLDAFRREGGY